jgi:hypothetical protein
LPSAAFHEKEFKGNIVDVSEFLHHQTQLSQQKNLVFNFLKKNASSTQQLVKKNTKKEILYAFIFFWLLYITVFFFVNYESSSATSFSFVFLFFDGLFLLSFSFSRGEASSLFSLLPLSSLGSFSVFFLELFFFSFFSAL